MVARNSITTQADMDALATAANAAMSAPYLTPEGFRDFEFSYFDESLHPPTNVVGVINYGSGDYSGDGTSLVVWVFSYKDVTGRRHYSKAHATGTVRFDTSMNPANVDWSWVASGDGEDGYVVIAGGEAFASGRPTGNLFGWWQLIAATSFNDDNFTGWLDPEDDGVYGGDYNPVTASPWRRELEYIKRTIYGEIGTPPPWTPDASWLVSGPWCVSVGTRLLNTNDSEDRYADVDFYYAADDHASDVTVTTEAVMGTIVNPYHLLNSVAGAQTTFLQALTFNDCPTGGTAVFKIVWTQTGSGTGWAHTLSVLSGAATINSESWVETSNTLTLEFNATLPTGASSLQIALTAASGTIVTHVFGINNYGDGVTEGKVIVQSDAVTPTDVPVIHPTSLGKMAACGSMDQTQGPVVMNTNSFYLSLYADGIEGVWAAMTRPVFCVNTYLESKLPNYAQVSQGDESGPRDTGENEDAVALVTPAVRARPSMWPVFRDEDFATWANFGGRKAPVPYFKGFNVSTNLGSRSLAAGAKISGSIFIPSNCLTAQIQAGDTALPIYYDQTVKPDPDVPATYLGFTTSPLRIPLDYAATLGANLLYTIKNNTAASVIFDLRSIIFSDGVTYHPGETPQFFGRDDDGRGVIESYSYNLTSPKNTGAGFASETPLSGYCIYELRVQRRATGSGIKVVPSTGTADLDVDIGLMRDCALGIPGTFELLQTVTIPADAASVTVEVFWPVLAGWPLAYQCNEAVEVFAATNFQPEYLVTFVPTSTAGARMWGTYSGTPVIQNKVLRFLNENWTTAGFHVDYVTHPVCAPIYNDLEAVIALI